MTKLLTKLMKLLWWGWAVSLPILLTNEFIAILTERGQQIFIVLGLAPIALGAVLVVVAAVVSFVWDTPADPDVEDNLEG